MALMDVHGVLLETFLRHQDALLSREFARAGEELGRFAELLTAHMADEEKWLLPLYAARAGTVPGGSPEFFKAEHRKLLGMLEKLQKALEAALRTGALDSRATVRLFDEEYQFKSLLEHHDLREHNILYPMLDQITAPGERQELLEKCFRPRWPGSSRSSP